MQRALALVAAAAALAGLAPAAWAAGAPDFVIAPGDIAGQAGPAGLTNPAKAEVRVTVHNQGTVGNAGWWLVQLAVCEEGASPRACAGIAAVSSEDALPPGASETLTLPWYTAGALGDVRVCALALLPEEPWHTNGDNLGARAVGVPVQGTGLSWVVPNHAQTYSLPADWC